MGTGSSPATLCGLWNIPRAGFPEILLIWKIVGDKRDRGQSALKSSRACSQTRCLQEGTAGTRGDSPRIWAPRASGPPGRHTVPTPRSSPSMQRGDQSVHRHLLAAPTTGPFYPQTWHYS